MKNKNIGILGLGNRSTLYYIDQLNKKFNALFKGYSTCPFILYNIDFDKVNPYLPNQFNKLKPLLSLYIKEIKSLGISFLLIPNITLHETIDKIYIDLDVAHPVQLTLEKLVERKQNEAVVFGSLYTMQSTYLKDAFLRKNIILTEPNEEDVNFIDYFRKQIYHEQETERDIKKYWNLLKSYSKKYPVIIGCTELSIYSLKDQDDLYDMALLQIERTLSIFNKEIK